MNPAFRIRELRKAAHMTQRELADSMGYKSDSAIPAEEGGDLYLINGNMLPLKNAGAFASEQQEGF